MITSYRHAQYKGTRQVYNTLLQCIYQSIGLIHLNPTDNVKLQNIINVIEWYHVNTLIGYFIGMLINNIIFSYMGARMGGKVIACYPHPPGKFKKYYPCMVFFLLMVGLFGEFFSPHGGLFWGLLSPPYKKSCLRSCKIMY